VPGDAAVCSDATKPYRWTKTAGSGRWNDQKQRKAFRSNHSILKNRFAKLKWFSQETGSGTDIGQAF
jgi:hypothetical protein